MGIERIGPTIPALQMAERVSREQPGRGNPPAVPPPQGNQDDAPFVMSGAMPAGALPDTLDGKALASALPAALAGKAALDALLSEPAAMQPNQLFASRQLVWHAPDPSVLAASWMVMIRNYAEQRAALMQQSQGRHLPAELFQSVQAPAALRGARSPSELVAELDAWRFAVYAWGGEKLVLRVVVRDADDDAPGASSASARDGRIALRLEVFLPQLGKVVLQIEPLHTGALLEIGAAQQATMQHMRQLLPRIGALATQCGVQIVRVRLMRELPAPGRAEPTASQIARLTKNLFDTMTEVALLLSQPQVAAALPVPDA